MNWARRRGPACRARRTCRFDIGRDLLTARALAGARGLRAQADVLAGRAGGGRLAGWRGAARAVPPAQRAAWAARLRPLLLQGLEAPALRSRPRWRASRFEWAAASAYATDALLDGTLARDLDLLVVLQGFQAEPLAAGACASSSATARCAWPLDRARPTPGAIALHAAADAADEAERAAACVLRGCGRPQCRWRWPPPTAC